jgi:DNA-binding transcriptional regulator YhcF (GntR family)
MSKLILSVTMSVLLLLPFAIDAHASAPEDISGGIVKMSGDVYVNEGTTVEGDVVTLRGNIYINGSVTGNAVAVFGDIIVNDGQVLGDAISVSGKVTVGEKGKIPQKRTMARSLNANPSSIYKALMTLINEDIIIFRQTGTTVLTGDFEFNSSETINKEAIMRDFIINHTIDEIIANKDIPRERVLEIIKEKYKEED